MKIKEYIGNEIKTLYRHLELKNAEYKKEIATAKEQRNALKQHIFDVLHSRGRIDYALIAETQRDILSELEDSPRRTLPHILTPDIIIEEDNFYINDDNGAKIPIDITFQINGKELLDSKAYPLVVVPKDNYDMLLIKQTYIQGHEDATSVNFTIYDIIKEAIRKDVSDVHFNYVGDLYYVLFRQAGRAVVQNQYTMNSEKSQKFFNEVRQKMALGSKTGFKTDEYNLPQGGIIEFPELGVRLRGEFTPSGQYDTRNRFVCRLLKKPTGKLGTIDDLQGYDEDILSITRRAVNFGKGLMLVVGVTNSGKSTYTSHFINSIPEDRIIATVEDPIEYDKSRPNATQHQVFYSDDKSISVDFLRYIKSDKRSDLDVSEIGEIRKDDDGGNTLTEAVVEGVKAGNFTIATTHIGSAFDVPLAMVSMYGVDRYVVADLLVFVVAQTLVEKLCKHCREEDIEQKNRATLKEWLEFGDIKYAWKKDLEDFINDSDKKSYVRNPNGCPHCEFSGVKGLVPIYEYYKPDVEMIMWLNKNLDTINKFDIELEFCSKEKKHLARNMLSVYVQKLMNGEVDADEKVITRVLMS